MTKLRPHDFEWEEALDSALESLRRHVLDKWELELVRSRVNNVLGRDPAFAAAPSSRCASRPCGPQSGVNTELPCQGLYIYSTLVSRYGRATGQLCTSMVQGYRYANSEDEARGMAVAYTTAAKPDFGIDQVLVLRVTDDEVLSCASAIEARRAAATEIDAVHESAVAESQTPNNSRTTP